MRVPCGPVAASGSVSCRWRVQGSNVVPEAAPGSIVCNNKTLTAEAWVKALPHIQLTERVKLWKTKPVLYGRTVFQSSLVKSR